MLYKSLGDNAYCFHRQLPCSPCLTAYNHRTSPCDGDNQCLKQITLEQVLAKAHEMLAMSKADRRLRRRTATGMKRITQHPLTLWVFKKRFMKFGTVGASGVVVNLGVLYLCQEFLFTAIQSTSYAAERRRWRSRSSSRP